MVFSGEVSIILFTFSLVGAWVAVVSYRVIKVCCFAAIMGGVVGQGPDYCGCL